MMNIGFFTCLVMAGLFAVVAVIFSLLREKAAFFVSGFNTLPREQRSQYDQMRLSRDNRNLFLLSAVIMAAGAVLSYFTSSAAAVAAFAVWLVYFFSHVHLDAEKAFAKYKK